MGIRGPPEFSWRQTRQGGTGHISPTYSKILSLNAVTALSFLTGDNTSKLIMINDSRAVCLRNEWLFGKFRLGPQEESHYVQSVSWAS